MKEEETTLFPSATDVITAFARIAEGIAGAIGCLTVIIVARFVRIVVTEHLCATNAIAALATGASTPYLATFATGSFAKCAVTTRTSMAEEQANKFFSATNVIASLATVAWTS